MSIVIGGARVRTLTAALAAVAGAALATPAAAQINRVAPGSVLYEGARLIIGDESAPIENGAMLVTNGYIEAVGRRGEIELPAGGRRMDLSGRTIMPTLTNVHIHIGYEGHPTWGQENFTPENVVDHLQREAFYGVGTVLSVGADPPEIAMEMIEDQALGKYPPAALYWTAPGVVPPNGGPDHILIRGTDALRAVYEVETEEHARFAVRDIAAKRLQQLKIWIGDRGGSYPAMPPEIYAAVIDEAHKYNIKVHAHVGGLADTKSVLRAGVDVLVHPIRELDAELEGLIRERRPYWVPLVGFVSRSRICDDDPFVLQTLPAQAVTEVRELTERGAELGRNVCNENPFGPVMNPDLMARALAAGARPVLGTDAGVFNHYTFGWSEHHEIERYVQLGMTPAQAIVAATSRPAELLGDRDGGKLARLYRADFIVLNANPLDDIRNTRQIESVYLRGAELDRDLLLSRWQQRAIPTR